MSNYLVHVAGPDDQLPFANELNAHRCANQINKTYLQQRLDYGNETPLLIATVSEVIKPKQNLLEGLKKFFRAQG